MQHAKPTEAKRSKPQPAEARAEQEAGSRYQRLYAEARRLMDAGDYEKARQLLNTGGSSDEMKNAKGVCLMRLGHFEDALRVYRNLVLQSGTMWMRPDASVSGTRCTR